MNNNPFTLAFGKKPLQYVSRIVQTDQIVEDYVSDIHGYRSPGFRKDGDDDQHCGDFFRTK